MPDDRHSLHGRRQTVDATAPPEDAIADGSRLAHLLLRGLAEVVSTVPITLPYRFDTSSVWRSILKGAFGLNALLVFSVFHAALVQQQIAKALGVTVMEGVAFVFTRIFVRFQTGSVGTLSSDQVVIEPNVLFGVTLPGPHGTYALDRFRAVRVEFRQGPIAAGVQGRPNEVVWLVGHPGTPDIVLALTEERAGRAVGREFGALLDLPVEEVGAPREITL